MANNDDILVEDVILSNLIFNEEYSKKVISFLKEDYFRDFNHKTIFNIVNDYIIKYNKRPTIDAIKIELQELTNITEDSYFNLLEYLSSLNNNPENNLEWLYTKTEEFGNDQAVHNALLACISIKDGSDKVHSKGMIPKLLTDALSVSLSTSLGHDYLEDADSRYDFYHNIEQRIPFDLHYLNVITKGGLLNKTLNILMAGVNVGKSLAMCHMAAANLMLGKNVLYISMEMARERISERIDMNLLDVTTDELLLMSKKQYLKKIENLKAKTLGKLIVEEYAPTTAGASQFRTLINDLYLKKNFKPDIIYVDYLNICMSSRIKMGSNVGSYFYVKSVAEEIRGLAVEFDVPIVSATQVTRSGISSSDPEMTDIAESIGLAATADLLLSISTDEDLEKLGQVVFKQLKTRYGNKQQNKKFVVGIDYNKMRLYDVEDQGDLLDGPEDNNIFDKSDFGERDNNQTGFEGLF